MMENVSCLPYFVEQLHGLCFPSFSNRGENVAVTVESANDVMTASSDLFNHVLVFFVHAYEKWTAVFKDIQYDSMIN